MDPKGTMELIDKKYLLLMVLEKLWSNKLTQVVELTVDPLRIQFSDSEIEYLLEYFQKEENIIEVITRPPYESGHPNIYKYFSYKLRIKNTFDSYLKTVRGDERYQRQQATIYEKENRPFPEGFRWTSNKTYMARKLVEFNSHKGNIVELFRKLEEARGGYVRSDYLIKKAKLHGPDNLRATITNLRKKLKDTGLDIVPLKEANTGGAYKLTVSKDM